MAKSVVSTNNAPQAIGPYSQAIKLGNMVYTAGQIPLDPATGKIVEGGIAEQADRVMKNVQGVLAAAGSSMDRAVKTTCFLANLDDFAAFNEVYGSLLHQHGAGAQHRTSGQAPRWSAG